MGLSTYDEIAAYWYLRQLPAEDVGSTLFAMDTFPGRTRIDSLFLTTDSTTDMEVQYILNDNGGNHNVIATVAVPALAGSVGVPAVDVLAALPAPLRAGFPLDVNCTFGGLITVAGDIGKTIYSCGLGGLL